MDPERWHSVQSIFWRVQGLDKYARERELVELCDADADLLAEVRSLLAAQQGSGILDHGEPLLAPLHDLLREPVPEQVGPYRARALERIGTVGELAAASRAVVAPAAVRAWRRHPVQYAAALVALVLGVVAAMQLSAPRLGAGRTATVAVLPFANLSGQEQSEHLADGLTEDILTQLSRVPGLQVRSRTSVMQYKSATPSIRDIGAALDVTYVLEGSVRRAGDDVRIAAQLIEARTDRHVWAETYDRRLTDLFLVQSEIARDIARALGARMTGGQSGVDAAPAYADAYEQFLLGRERFHTRTLEAVEEAIALLRGVLQREPDYALAHAFLANAYVRSVGADYARVGQRAWLDTAEHHARRAIALAPQLPDGYVALGATLNAMGRRGAAIQQHTRALAADPNYAFAMFELARALRIGYRFDEAAPWIERALAIDPARADYRGFAVTLYDGLAMPDEARRHVQAGLRLNPADVILHWEGLQLELAADDTAAAAEHLRAYIAMRPAERDRMTVWFEHTRGNSAAAKPYVDRLLPVTTAWYDLDMFGSVYRAVGDTAKGDSLQTRAREMARRGAASHAGSGPTADLLRAQTYASSGDHEQALRYLESWMNAGGVQSWQQLEQSQSWGTLRTHPRFLEIVARTRARHAEMRDRVRAQLATDHRE